ncbi:AP-4 complex subunit epsilon [Leucoagaricus sp. SymC.cos]|nr:AP-4 complex subunit epsilon [Leucoagaricus sp. SymC.cos]
MDVPFISSGALSRAHYALIRKVEESTSEGSINRILEAEIKSIRERLARPGQKRSKEALILLLYCSMTATTSIFPPGTFDFALPHALSLAEAGSTIEDKRTGYLFCAEMMQPNHDLRLMLVNTLRKDLDHDSISRVCLALDNIILSSSADVIPAIQSRLHDLLSHKHPSVRRRALYAIRSLSRHEPELLDQVQPKLLRRLQDPDTSVAGAAFRVAQTIPNSAPVIQDAVNDVFESTVQVYVPTERGTMLASLDATRGVGLRTLSLPAAFDLLTSCTAGHDLVTVMGLFRLFKDFDPLALRTVEEQTQISLVGTIRDYLISRTPNEIYLFLSCLESVDPSLWAGTSGAIPAVLDAWEVGQIMQLLDSGDDLLRKKTLHLLGKVDEGILGTFYSRAVSITTRVALPLKEINERTKRLLEVVGVISGDNGELYADQVKELLARLESHISGNAILDSAIEGVLVHIRLGESSFQLACAATMLTSLCDMDAEFGPTMMIILAALATEYSRLVSLSPLELLSGICHRLKGKLPFVQEPCLLAMLRIAADCEEIPPEVTRIVSEASQNAGRHIRRRCDQFLTLSSKRDVLGSILSRSKTLALPDFLEVLETYNGTSGSESSTLGAKFPQSSSALPQQTEAASSGTSDRNLRYEAYETPQAIPSLRTGRPFPPQRSSLGAHSNLGSVNGRLSDTMIPESLPHTVAHESSTQTALFVEADYFAEKQPKPKGAVKTDVEDLSSRVDLIAFDSPFEVEPGQTEVSGIKSAQEVDFESTWNSDQDLQLSARGWCDAPMNDVIRRLQGIDQHRLQVTPTDVPPFMGDLKISIVQDGANNPRSVALLRLKDSEEDTSLWRLRCNDVVLRDEVKQLLGSR